MLQTQGRRFVRKVAWIGVFAGLVMWTAGASGKHHHGGGSGPVSGEPGGQKPVSIVPITAPLAPDVDDSRPLAVVPTPAPTTAPSSAGPVGAATVTAAMTPLAAVSPASIHDADVRNSLKDIPRPGTLSRTP